ncbi:hypothetical protein [Paraburkholderia sp. MM5477-R1]|uniref:hypothetical protein n=1 Tax=Paraburkholderia sp. MM5477-R1 TaxID=2991062 RepID=UPI003D23D6D1
MRRLSLVLRTVARAAKILGRRPCTDNLSHGDYLIAADPGSDFVSIVDIPMSLSVFEMHSVELRCQRPLGACYVICDEWHFKACLRKAADLERAKADTREFLGIAGLNHSEWERDQDLIKSIGRRLSLPFQAFRDRDPDTDGWWVINALLAEVRRGGLLAVKGRRADLFPQTHSTPLTNFAVRAADLPNDRLIRSGPYEQVTRQVRLFAAPAAASGRSSDGSLLDVAVAVIGARAGDGDASTLLGDAQPFEYQSGIADVDSFDIAKTPNEGEPGTWYTNPGSGQMRLFGDDGKPVVDLDFDHFHNGMKPHAHNWNGSARDGGGLVVPFSPWNP